MYRRLSFGKVAAKGGSLTRFSPVFVGGVALAVAGITWALLLLHVADYWDGASDELREDFVAYYAAASLIERGIPDAIYDPDIVADVEESILGRPAGRSNGLVFLNPPFIAGALQPLVRLPYGQAQAVWFAITAAVVAASIALLWPELRRLPRPWGVIFAIGALASLPVFWSLLYAQLTPFVLLSWVGFYRLYASKHEGPAGFVLALSLVKAHLVIAPLLFLLVKGRWRAIAGFTAGAALFVGGSVAFVGWETAFRDYPALLIRSLSWQSEFGVNRVHMLSWSSMLLTLFPTMGLMTKLGISLLLSAATFLAAGLVWRSRERLDDGVLPVTALAVATVVGAPHVHLQDMQIFLLPAALFVACRRDVVGLLGAVLLLFAIPASSFGPNVAPLLLGALLLLLVVAARRGRHGGWRTRLQDGPHPLIPSPPGRGVADRSG